eukprot:TRINITY_DN91985_c0_g1_i1.p1 TRINITY_DN91985_c0_g1~~TRINITY_DN91985_c0_g1_i1.p1  ORF type:complete len:1573 (-),score=387.00 TRINITY_DN91985_c0_g1_i1:110-4828(-)
MLSRRLALLLAFLSCAAVHDAVHQQGRHRESHRARRVLRNEWRAPSVDQSDVETVDSNDDLASIAEELEEELREGEDRPHTPKRRREPAENARQLHRGRGRHSESSKAETRREADDQSSQTTPPPATVKTRRDSGVASSLSERGVKEGLPVAAPSQSAQVQRGRAPAAQKAGVVSSAMAEAQRKRQRSEEEKRKEEAAAAERAAMQALDSSDASDASDALDASDASEASSMGEDMGMSSPDGEDPPAMETEPPFIDAAPSEGRVDDGESLDGRDGLGLDLLPSASRPSVAARSPALSVGSSGKTSRATSDAKASAQIDMGGQVSFVQGQWPAAGDALLASSVDESAMQQPTKRPPAALGQAMQQTAASRQPPPEAKPSDTGHLGEGFEIEYNMVVAIAYSAVDQDTVKPSPVASEVKCSPLGCYVLKNSELQNAAARNLSDSQLRFVMKTNESTTLRKDELFFIRPLPDEPLMGCVQYGQQIVIAKGQKMDKDPLCGWYGCSVASLDDENRMILGPGEDAPTTFFIRAMPPEEGVPMASGCVKYGDRVVLARSNETGRDETCGWYGCSVAYMNPSKQMRFRAGGDSPAGFFLRSEPLPTRTDLNAPCEAHGTLLDEKTRGESFSATTLNVTAVSKAECRNRCSSGGALYYSYNAVEDGGSCRCGKRKSFAWLLSSASAAVNPHFQDVKPCSEDPKQWCTMGIDCKRCLLTSYDGMTDVGRKKYLLGDCEAIRPSQDCEALTEGQWTTVHQKECFQACQLLAYDGMALDLQKTIKIGQCKPLQSMEAAACEDWKAGKWETVSKADCSQSGEWKAIGRFEEPSAFVSRLVGGHSGKWRKVGGADVKFSKGTEPYHPLAWMEIQQDCRTAKSKYDPGELSITVPTRKGAHYTLIFQASYSKDHDMDGIARGSVTVDGLATEYVTPAQFNGVDMFEWTTIELAFQGADTVTHIVFSEPGDQCLQVREVILRNGVSSAKQKAQTWQTFDALKQAFNRIGCPTQDYGPTSELRAAVDVWAAMKEDEAILKMWRTCEGARDGDEDDTAICCGAGKKCTPKVCKATGSVETKLGYWYEWLDVDIPGTIVEQAGSKDSGGRPRAAIDRQPGLTRNSRSCSQTNVGGFSNWTVPENILGTQSGWWTLTLPSAVDISAVRITTCKDCLMEEDNADGEGPSAYAVSVATDGGLPTSTMESVMLRPGEVTEVPFKRSSQVLHIARLGMMKDLALCEVEVQVWGNANQKESGPCLLELNSVNFKGTGDLKGGHMKEGEYLESRMALRRPITVTAEMKADSPECISMTLFAPDHEGTSGYVLQTGVSKIKAIALPGTNNEAKLRPNNYWHKLQIEAAEGGRLHYSIGNIPMFSAKDEDLKSGALQFVAGCVGARVRNVQVHSHKRCTVTHRACAVKLPVIFGSQRWTGTGNVNSGTLLKGQHIETISKFARPLKVSAEIRADYPACIAMQLFGEKEDVGQSKTGYVLMTGVRRYQVKIEPGGFVKDVGQNHKWHHVEIHVAADGTAMYYVNSELIQTVKGGKTAIGGLRFLAPCIGMEVRKVLVELEANCQVKQEGVQTHELWMAMD